MKWIITSHLILLIFYTFSYIFAIALYKIHKFDVQMTVYGDIFL